MFEPLRQFLVARSNSAHHLPGICVAEDLGSGQDFLGDAFMDGYDMHEKGGQSVTYERLRAMGTNGFKDGKIIGTKRLYADGKFGGKDGMATVMETPWRGLQAARQGSREEQVAVPH